jgi:ATP-dependent DNA helicase RecG
VRFLERLGENTLRSFSTDDFLALDALHREQPLPQSFKDRLPGLVSVGAIEVVGRGRGARYILSEALYAALGAKGTHTRKKGLDHDTNKALLLKHLSKQAENGAPLAELRQVLPALPSSAVQSLMSELRDERRVYLVGLRRWARWRLSEYRDFKLENL